MTTHVFIVDNITFKYHLEYMFAGTGAGDLKIDFNGLQNSNLHFARENNLLAMICDIKRIRQGDLVIFYLQQNYQKEIYEGKFYGIFQVASECFLDNNDEEQFLHDGLDKSLTFRIKINPYKVYANGVTEWEALDEIKDISSPNQMLWSLIYRKLKGNRGNTMITHYESDRLIKLIRNKNKNIELTSKYFTFNENNQKIDSISEYKEYIGRNEYINIFPRLREKFSKNLQFETHLQAYILEHIRKIDFFKDKKIDFLGNEVSCGVGMQRIDILVSILRDDNSHLIVPIELKSCEVYPEILSQMQRYVDWLEQYYIPNCPNSDILPMIICRKTDRNINDFKNKAKEFNLSNSKIDDIKYLEFDVLANELKFEEIF